MRLTQILFSYLNRVFSTDPAAFLALTFSYDGTSLAWTVADGVLSTQVVGGSGENLSIDLSQYTVQSLVDYLASQRGYSVSYIDRSDNATLGALVLLDVAGIRGDNTDCSLFGYTSLLYVYFEAISLELGAAQDAATAAPRQLSILDAGGTEGATGYWLDELGGYFGSSRNPNENDNGYARHMTAEITQVRCNNVAMEIAIEHFTGLPAEVSDVTTFGAGSRPFDGSITFDGSHSFAGELLPQYGLFDVSYQYDFSDGADPGYVQTVVTKIVNGSRAIGTQPRNITWVAS